MENNYIQGFYIEVDDKNRLSVKLNTVLNSYMLNISPYNDSVNPYKDNRIQEAIIVCLKKFAKDYNKDEENILLEFKNKYGLINI